MGLSFGDRFDRDLGRLGDREAVVAVLTILAVSSLEKQVVLVVSIMEG